MLHELAGQAQAIRASGVRTRSTGAALSSKRVRRARAERTPYVAWRLHGDIIGLVYVGSFDCHRLGVREQPSHVAFRRVR
eukprot:4532098-Pleurochrysis_carterae.AAC.7